MPIDPKVLEKLDKDREFRQIDFSRMELRSSEGGEMVVEGYATTFNQPYLLFEDGNYRVMEEIDSRAFAGCDMSDVVFLVNHTGRVPARTKNGTLQIKTDSHGLHQRAQLGGTEYGRQVFEEIKGGYMDQMSMSFKVGKDERKVTEDHEAGTITVHRRVLEFSKLYDVSVVTFPANPATEISARSIGEGVIADAREQLQLLQAEIENRQSQREEIRRLLAKKPKGEPHGI